MRGGVAPPAGALPAPAALPPRGGPAPRGTRRGEGCALLGPGRGRRGEARRPRTTGAASAGASGAGLQGAPTGGRPAGPAACPGAEEGPAGARTQVGCLCASERSGGVLRPVLARWDSCHTCHPPGPEGRRSPASAAARGLSCWEVCLRAVGLVSALASGRGA